MVFQWNYELIIIYHNLISLNNNYYILNMFHFRSSYHFTYLCFIIILSTILLDFPPSPLYTLKRGIIILLISVFMLSIFFRCPVVIFTTLYLYWNKNIYRNPINFQQNLLIVRKLLKSVITIHLYKSLLFYVYL